MRTDKAGVSLGPGERDVFCRHLERLKKYCGRLEMKRGSGLFGFWLRFGSVTGHCGHAPAPKPRQNPKILAPNGHSISLTALKAAFRRSRTAMEGWQGRKQNLGLI